MITLSKLVKEKNYRGAHIYSVENMITQCINFIGKYNITIDKHSTITINRVGVSFMQLTHSATLIITSPIDIDAITLGNDIFYLGSSMRVLRLLIDYAKEHTNFKKIVAFDYDYRNLYNCLSGIHAFNKINYNNEKLRVLVTNTERLFIRNMSMKGITKTYFCNPHGMKKFEKYIKVKGEEYYVFVERNEDTGSIICQIDKIE